MSNNYSSTLADAVEQYETQESKPRTEPFISADDERLKKDWCLVNKDNQELSVLYICSRTGNFLTSKRLSKEKCINPLEHTKDGKFIGFCSRYDIAFIKQIE